LSAGTETSGIPFSAGAASCACLSEPAGAPAGSIFITKNTGLAGKRLTLSRKLLEYESARSRATPGQAVLTTVPQLDSRG
jgi:hypothetical protein